VRWGSLWGRTDPDLAADIAATSLAGMEVIRSLLGDAMR
jgi:hypothetical protein